LSVSFFESLPFAALFTVDADTLDSARFSVGTDEDMLIIEVPPAPAEYHDREAQSGGGAVSTLESQEMLGAQSVAILTAATRVRDQAAGATDQFWRSADQVWSALFSGHAGASQAGGCGGGGGGSGIKNL
jgi:hypothetical protein